VRVLAWLRRAFLFGRLRSGAGDARVTEASFAVLDVDVTGTNVDADRVTGIAALPVTEGVFRIRDLRYCSLVADPGRAADGGRAVRNDYLALREFVAGRPIVTYNPEFVREMIGRTARARSLPRLGGEWIDIAAAAGVVGGEENELATMDYWLAHMKTGSRGPHDATTDVLALAQLLQAVIAYAPDAGIDTVGALARSDELRTWLRAGV
jgi:hypothetical protein